MIAQTLAGGNDHGPKKWRCKRPEGHVIRRFGFMSGGRRGDRKRGMETPSRSAGILAMAATAFLWSIAGLFIKVIDWNPFAIAGMRSLIASIIIFIYLHSSPPSHSVFISCSCACKKTVRPLNRFFSPTGSRLESASSYPAFCRRPT